MNELQRQVLRNRQIRIEISQPFRTQPMPDNRYRVLVNLMRSERPEMWTFTCMRCGTKIVELMNCQVYGIDDFYDPQNLRNVGIGRHCKGRLSDGMLCPYTYFFNLQ